MSLLRRFAVLSFVAAAGLALPSAALAGHQHSRNCGHRYNYGHRGHDSRYDQHAYRGHGYSYAPRYSYRPRYAAPYYSGRYGYSYDYDYGYGAPYYDDGYYGGYSYAPPPPPRCHRRPRVGLYFGF